MAFDALPSYKDEDVFLVQSSSIVRYVAKKHGLAGCNLVEESLIDQYYEGVQDLVGLLRTGLNVYYPVVTPATTETINEQLTKIAKEKFPKFVSYFERALSGKTFLVGDKLSYADIGLFYAVDNFLEIIPEYFERVLAQNDNLKEFHQSIKSRERIQKHLNNPKRFPKQPLPPGIDAVLAKVEL